MLFGVDWLGVGMIWIMFLIDSLVTFLLLRAGDIISFMRVGVCTRGTVCVPVSNDECYNVFEFCLLFSFPAFCSRAVLEHSI